MNSTDQAPDQATIDGNVVATTSARRIQRLALIAGLLGIALALAGAFMYPDQFWRSYLLAYTYWLQIALGCLGMAMLHHVVGGRWSALIRRWMEAGAMTLPLLTLFFIPLLFGMGTLYPWSNPDQVQQSPLMQQKALYLNLPFFMVRAALYFLVWNGLASLLNRWSHEQDRTGDARLAIRMRRLSTVGLILLVLTATFAAYDWLMSLEPEWYSSIYGLIFIAGQGLAALAVAILGLRVLARRDPAGQDWARSFNDLGSFTLAFVMIWAYFSFSQFLIIWSANINTEITWYYYRLQGQWAAFALLLFVFDFALPFFALLSRSFKRRFQLLTVLAILILCGRWVELYWLIMPAFWPEGLHFHWLDIALLAGLGGIWLAVFIRLWLGKAPLPQHDPHLGEVHEQSDRFAPVEQST
jgi:hypothetical protein